jgi:uncharacterized membrane protein YbhN (UPF0104 family)
MRKISIVGLLKTVLPLLLGIYLIWYFFNGMSEKSLAVFYSSLREANYVWIFLALVLSFLAICIRAYRWKYVLEPIGYKTKFWNRYHALMIGYLVNLTIPRAGEASRAAMLFRSDGVPFSKSFGTIIGERAVDLIMLASVAALTALLGYDAFMNIFHQIQTQFAPADVSEGGLPWKLIIYSVVGIFLTGLILIMFFNTKWRSKLIQFAQDVIAGVLSIFKSKNPGAYIFQTIFIWVLYIVYFAIPFLSLEQTKDFPMDGILLAFIAGSLGITFTNGGIGTFPILVGMVIVFYLGDTVPDALAIGNALGMIIWVSQTLLLIILGLISLILLPKNNTKENVKTQLPKEQNS